MSALSIGGLSGGRSGSDSGGRSGSRSGGRSVGHSQNGFSIDSSSTQAFKAIGSIAQHITHKKDVVSIDMLCGTAILDPRLACRLIG